MFLSSEIMCRSASFIARPSEPTLQNHSASISLATSSSTGLLQRLPSHATVV
jgi:hypothetical protein